MRHASDIRDLDQKAGLRASGIALARPPAWRIDKGWRDLLPVARKAVGLSGLTAAGQLTFLLALPALSHLFTPAEFGVFTIYLSIANIGGPLVGLKFESALYGARSREDARLTLAVSAFSILAMTIVAAVAFQACGPSLSGLLGQNARAFSALAPAGMFMAGLWGVSTAWAIHHNAMRRLGVARFLQPAAMTALQLSAGYFHLSSEGLIVSHLLSHGLYAIYIFAPAADRAELRQAFRARPGAILERARETIRFPLYVMPAQAAALAVANLPAILIGSIYGAHVAGHYGMAYRVIAAPVAIISLPLSNIFTGEASRDQSLTHLKRAGLHFFLFSLLLVALPIFAFGLVAPDVALWLLGPNWVATGQIASALALMAAAQALTTPFSELTSIHRFQSLRLVAETLSAALVFTPIAIGFAAGWSANATIWTMSAAGAGGSLLGLLMICAALRARLSNEEASHAPA